MVWRLVHDKLSKCTSVDSPQINRGFCLQPLTTRRDTAPPAAEASRKALRRTATPRPVRAARPATPPLEPRSRPRRSTGPATGWASDEALAWPRRGSGGGKAHARAPRTHSSAAAASDRAYLVSKKEARGAAVGRRWGGGRGSEPACALRTTRTVQSRLLTAVQCSVCTHLMRQARGHMRTEDPARRESSCLTCGRGRRGRCAVAGPAARPAWPAPRALRGMPPRPRSAPPRPATKDNRRFRRRRCGRCFGRLGACPRRPRYSRCCRPRRRGASS